MDQADRDQAGSNETTADNGCEVAPCVCAKRLWMLFLGLTLCATIGGLAIQRTKGVDPDFLDADGWGQRGFWLAAGRGLIDGDGSPSAMRGPIVPLIYAGATLAFGKSYAVLLVVQAVFFGLTAGLVGVLAQFVFRCLGVTLLSVAMYMLYIPAYPWLCNIFSEPIFTALQTLFLLTWIVALERVESGGRWFALGVMFAIVALCRPVMYFFLPFVLAYSLWRCGWSRRFVRPLAWMLVGFAVLETPWVVRNYYAVGQLVLTTSGSSQVLHAATWYQHPNWMNNIYHDSERFPPEAEGFWDLPKAEQDRRFREMAWENLRTAPVRVLLLIPKRAMMFFFQMREFGWLPTAKSILLSGILYPTALLGYFFATRRQRQLLGPCLLTIAFTAAFYTLLQAEFRYSHPIQPYIIVLSASGMGWLTNSARQLLRPADAAPTSDPS